CLRVRGLARPPGVVPSSGGCLRVRGLSPPGVAVSASGGCPRLGWLARFRWLPRLWWLPLLPRAGPGPGRLPLLPGAGPRVRWLPPRPAASRRPRVVARGPSAVPAPPVAGSVPGGVGNGSVGREEAVTEGVHPPHGRVLRRPEPFGPVPVLDLLQHLRVLRDDRHRHVTVRAVAADPG